MESFCVQQKASPRLHAQHSRCRRKRLFHKADRFGVKCAGFAGRRCITVGTLMYRDFQCSADVRSDSLLLFYRLSAALGRTWFAVRSDLLRRNGLGWWLLVSRIGLVGVPVLWWLCWSALPARITLCLSSSSGGGFEVAGDGFGGIRNVLRLCAAERGVDE